MASALVVSSAVVFFRVSGGGPGVSVRVAHYTRPLDATIASDASSDGNVLTLPAFCLL
jgi:hypothetical protein